MKKALVVGGNSGIGLACVLELLDRKAEHVYIAGKDAPVMQDIPEEMQGCFAEKTSFMRIDLNTEDYTPLDAVTDIDTLLITAGFGRVALFEDLTQTEIKNLIKCNELGAIQVIKKYYTQLKSKTDFHCAVMVSIAGHVASPFFSVYGAAKTGLAAWIENVNVELAAGGYDNRILDVSPGSLKGTAFNGGKNDLSQVRSLAAEILEKAQNHETLYIPQYETVYQNVLERYHADAMAFGMQSYDYKVQSGRISKKPQVVVGYLSGTFDLFHIGHLNLLRRAKQQCDYLIVGVHESGAWKGKETFIPFEERCEIVGSIQYVDKVIPSFPEDADAWSVYHYDKLFVGSDYKGTERFQRYEEYFKDKGVEIVYFSYTKGTSSTKLREALNGMAKR
jgi:glycerol-3-phosphate cytidylyltransferase